jgi:putative transposase
MTEKFQNKYRIGSHRKPGWDYSSDGHYFITLVVQNRHEVLGRIENHEMKLNTWGEIVLDEWIKSFKMRAELFCDAFVVMPTIYTPLLPLII